MTSRSRWAAVAGPAGLAAGVSGWGPPLAAWPLTAAAAVAAVAVAARTARLRSLSWAACALSAASGCLLLMDVIALLFGQPPDSWTGAALHALGLAGAVLSGAAAGRGRGRDAAAPGRPGRWIAYVGVLSFVPYAAMKLTWALGGTFGGITGAEMLAAYERNGASGLWMTLERWGLDGTVLMALIGILLLFCPIRPWGLRLPRWLPLTPALIGAGTLVPYGLLGLGYLALVRLGVAAPSARGPPVRGRRPAGGVDRERRLRGLRSGAPRGRPLVLARHPRRAGHGRPVTTAVRVVPAGKAPDSVRAARAQSSLAT
ncbi:hypothetical protein [Streptomyces sp. NBC_00272]|uniref:hypothetical protein n=2 Tax=Streptomyces TaxID=1883 RepID=UPI002E2967C6|nr:hypothetical protein [Streptomyces sp. NBC_00272]